MSAAALYLGLISGTSADGIDVALAEFDPAPRLLATRTLPYDPALRTEILALAQSEAAFDLDAYGRLDVRIGEAFAAAANALLQTIGSDVGRAHALGSHGQTVRHRPQGAHPFTLQIGDGVRSGRASPGHARDRVRCRSSPAG